MGLTLRAVYNITLLLIRSSARGIGFPNGKGHNRLPAPVFSRRGGRKVASSSRRAAARPRTTFEFIVTPANSKKFQDLRYPDLSLFETPPQSAK
jgi:hypothetical protein